MAIDSLQRENMFISNALGKVISEKSNTPIELTSSVLEAMCTYIIESIKQDKEVVFPNFLTFKQVIRKPRVQYETNASIAMSVKVMSMVTLLLNKDDDATCDRTVFAFENGIYLAKTDTFVQTGTPEYRALNKVTPVNSFQVNVDIDIVNNPDFKVYPKKIPTPALQTILSFQGMCSETTFWMYAMIGRLLYDVGEMDNWSIIPFLHGIGGSDGTSIIINMCRSIYKPHHVGDVSSTNLVDKLVFISSEDIQASLLLPAIMCGNLETKHSTSGGTSINPHILMFKFLNIMKDSDDAELSSKIYTDLGLLIIKANRCYRIATNQYGTKNIWDVLPRSLVTICQDIVQNGPPPPNDQPPPKKPTVVKKKPYPEPLYETELTKQSYIIGANKGFKKMSI
jgi:nucleoid DNA-binding protein